MVEESLWLLGLQQTAVASSAWQWLDGVGHHRDDDAREVGYLSTSSWVMVARCGGFV